MNRLIPRHFPPPEDSWMSAALSNSPVRELQLAEDWLQNKLSSASPELAKNEHLQLMVCSYGLMGIEPMSSELRRGLELLTFEYSRSVRAGLYFFRGARQKLRDQISNQTSEVSANYETSIATTSNRIIAFTGSTVHVGQTTGCGFGITAEGFVRIIGKENFKQFCSAISERLTKSSESRFEIAPMLWVTGGRQSWTKLGRSLSNAA